MSKINLVDTHCHIQSLGQTSGEITTRSLWAKAHELKISQVIDEAKESGVEQIVCVGCELDDSILAVDFVKDRPYCYAAIGIHPHEADGFINDKSRQRQFQDLINRPKIVAIGECGLDYFYNHSSQDNQAKTLRFQIELALKADLPIIFHVREAFDDFWPIFESYSDIRGVLHSYTDSSKNLKRALDHGLYIGVNGIATFTKNLNQLDMYKSIPLNRLVLETDAPFLSPVPFRGKVCQPKYVVETAKFLSQLRQENIDELSNQTTTNANGLFDMGKKSENK